MYSSQSEADAPFQDRPAFTKHKSADEKIKARQADQTHKPISPRSPHPQRHRDGDANAKSPYPQRRDNDRADGTGKPVKKDSQKSPYPQRRGNSSGNYPPKSPRGHRRSTESFKQRNNSENSNVISVQGASNAEGVDGILPKSLDSSADINDDKPNESLNHAENNDGKNDSAQSPIETSTIQAVEPVLESTNHGTENDKVEQTLLDEAASPEIESVMHTEEGARCEEIMEDKPSDNLNGEASGVPETKRTIDSTPGTSTDSQAINCSTDSGLTSNDSGYIEQPSNDSIQDVSANDTLETSGIVDTSSSSSEFLNSEQIAEDRSVIDDLAVEENVSNVPVVEIPESSPSKLEITSQPEAATAGFSIEEKSNESVIDSCIEESAGSISQVQDGEIQSVVTEEGENGSHDKANEIGNIQSIAIELKGTDSNSVCEEADATKDPSNSASSLLETHPNMVEMSKSVHDKPVDSPQGSPSDNANKSSDQLEPQDKAAENAEKSFETVENSGEPKTTFNYESKAEDNITEKNDAIENVAETASSRAIEKH